MDYDAQALRMRNANHLNDLNGSLGGWSSAFWRQNRLGGTFGVLSQLVLAKPCGDIETRDLKQTSP